MCQESRIRSLMCIVMHCPNLAIAIEVSSGLMGLIHASQARSEGTEEWNCIKLDAANGWHNMMIYKGLVCHSCGADSHVIVIPEDTELKQWSVA